MSSKHFSWLLAATLVIGIVVALLPERTSKDSEFEAQPLLPDLAGQVNELELVQVVGAGNVTLATLQRQDNSWVVEEFQGYTANWPQLRELLAALAKARIVEPKTSNPEYFSRLGVSDVANADSKAVQLQLKGKQLDLRVLVGNAAEGREGQYVRLPGGDRAFLIDQKLDIPAEAKDWLQRDIVNISDAEVVEFELQHSDGAVIKASKASADDEDFVLQDIPEGREVSSSWSVNSIANALSNLQLDAVAAADTVDFTAATKFRLLTADGLEVLAELVEVEEQDWLRLSASVHESEATKAIAELVQNLEEVPALADEEGVTETAASDAANTEADAEAEPAEATEGAAQQRAEEINRRVHGWAYVIPSFKADSINKRLNDLLKPLPESE